MNIAGGDTGGGVSRHVRDCISRVMAAGGGMSRHGVTTKNSEKHRFDCARSFRVAFSFSLSLFAGLEISRSRQCVPKTVERNAEERFKRAMDYSWYVIKPSEAVSRQSQNVG